MATTFRTMKIYVDSISEIYDRINELRKNPSFVALWSVKPATPEVTTTGQCYEIYYEYTQH